MLGSHWYLGQYKADGCESNKKKVVKKDSPRPRKKARKEAPAEASEEAPTEASEEVHTVARLEVTTTVGVLTKEDIKTMFKDIVDAMREGFGTCLKEIKYLSEMVEVVDKKGWYHHKTERDRDIISKQRDRDIISKHCLST